MKEVSSSENSKVGIYPAEMQSGNTNAMEKIMSAGIYIHKLWIK